MATAKSAKQVTKVVNIVVHDDTITVSPTVVRVSRNDVVQWQGDVESFVLAFREGNVSSRASRVEVRSGPGKMMIEGWLTRLLSAAKELPERAAVATVRFADEPGIYPYQLAIWDGRKLHLDAGCPEVIIE